LFIQNLAEVIEKLTSTLDQIIYNTGVLKGIGSLTSVGLDSLKDNISVNLFGAYSSAIAFVPFVQKSNYERKVFVFIGSSFGSVTTYKLNFDMHNQVFGTRGINATAAYDISKVGVPFYAMSSLSIL
jgi:NAD(P)-dependent dehydrogenase (short-subunit alcohol dehydrogenase family)